jgi:hypothetical protein
VGPTSALSRPSPADASPTYHRNRRAIGGRAATPHRGRAGRPRRRSPRLEGRPAGSNPAGSCCCRHSPLRAAGVYLSILSTARPGPPMNLTGRAWAEILKPANFFFARARPEMLFLVVLHYKMRGRPAQARVRPEPDRKLRPDASSGMVMDRIFRPEITDFFQPGPNPTPPKKCSGLGGRAHRSPRQEEL